MLTDRLIAITVVALLSTVTLLSVKSRLLNRHLVALARQFRLHHLLALGTGVGMLLHVALAFWRDWPDSLHLYLAINDLATVAGWLALVLLLIVISSSYIRRLKWKHWYLLHLLSLPAFALLAIHIWAYARTRSADLVVLATLFGIIVAGISAALAERFSAASSLRFSVVSNKQVSDGIREIHLVSPGAQDNRAFPAGSIVYLRFVGAGFSRQWHPFSVASCRLEDNLRLLVKGLGSDTSHIADLHRADHVLIRGPYREFTPDFSRQQIWIAGGIGIAPFAGYAACLRHYPHGRVALYHFIEHDAQQLDIEAYAGESAGRFDQFNQVTLPHSRPDITRVVDAARRQPAAQFIICGPPAFMRYVRHALKRAGIDGRNIETEEFMPW